MGLCCKGRYHSVLINFICCSNGFYIFDNVDKLGGKEKRFVEGIYMPMYPL